MTPYICKRGGTLAIRVEVLTGLMSSITGTPVAKMKAFRKGGALVMPGSDVPVAAALTVTAGQTGWTLTLPSSVSQTLNAGFYLVDLSYVVSGLTYVDGPVLVEIQNAASVTISS